MGSSLSMLLDLENLGTAVGILFLSYLRAEIYDIAYVLQVNYRHL